MYGSAARASASTTFGQRLHFVSGAWEYEHDGGDEHTFRWLGADATLQLPDRPGAARLRLATDHAAEGHGASPATPSATFAVTRAPQWFDVPLSAPAVDVVNNAGSELVRGAVGADRGLYDPDGARYLRAHGGVRVVRRGRAHARAIPP